MESLSILTRPLRAAAAIAALAIAAIAGLSIGDSPPSQAATKYTAFAGNGARGIAVEAFLPNVIFVNEGDTLEWVNPYEEIHTVTFLAGTPLPDLIVPAGPPTPPGVAPPPGPPKLMFNPRVANPTTAASYDGTAYANSGIIGKGQTFSLTFPKRGQYDFLCVIHPGMVGQVQVLPPGVFVPTQAQRDVDAAAQLAPQLAAGEASAAASSPLPTTTNANGTRNWSVVNAPSVGQADVMRFIPSRLQIGAGDTVTWTNNTPVPHTVTFGPVPDLVVPEFGPGGPSAGPPNLVINNRVLFPVKPSQSYEAGYANSGFISAGPEGVAGTTFSLTFPKAGTYSYVCVLHADQGMAGVIQVGAPSAISPPSTGDAGLQDGWGPPLAGWQISLAGIALLLGVGVYLCVRRPSAA